MFEPVKIAPSILSADFMKLGRDIALIEEAGAGYVHVDVMDGHFVPNLTMGVPIVRQLKKATALPLDVHLMIDNPLEQLPWFLDAGADLVTVHAEVLDADGLARAVASIHAGRGQGGRQPQAAHGARRAGAPFVRRLGHGAGHERGARFLRAELYRGQRGEGGPRGRARALRGRLAAHPGRRRHRHGHGAARCRLRGRRARVRQRRVRRRGPGARPRRHRARRGRSRHACPHSLRGRRRRRHALLRRKRLRLSGLGRHGAAVRGGRPGHGALPGAGPRQPGRGGQRELAARSRPRRVRRARGRAPLARPRPGRLAPRRGRVHLGCHRGRRRGRARHRARCRHRAPPRRRGRLRPAHRDHGRGARRRARARQAPRGRGLPRDAPGAEPPGLRGAGRARGRAGRGYRARAACRPRTARWGASSPSRRWPAPPTGRARSSTPTPCRRSGRRPWTWGRGAWTPRRSRPTRWAAPRAWARCT